MQTIETIKHRGKTICIYQDEDAQSPQEYGDNGMFLVAGHRDFYVGPPGQERGFDVAQVIEDHRETHWVFPLEAYIHSGVALALSGEGNFPDRQWDVSQLGAVLCAKKEWRLQKSARRAALSYVQTWNQYLSGDVYGYVVDEGGADKSCWGFYGLAYCITEAKSVADSIIERERKARMAKLKTYIANRVPLSKRFVTVNT